MYFHNIKNRKNLFLLVLLFVSGFSKAQNPVFKTVIQTGHAKLAQNLRIGPSGKFAVSYASDNSVILWDLTLLKQIGTYQLENGIKVVDFGPAGRYVYIYTSMEGLFRWDTETGESKTVIPEDRGNVTHVMIWEDYKSIVTVHNDRFKVIDIETGKILLSKIIDEDKGYAGKINVSKKNDLLIVSFSAWKDSDSRLIIYDLATLNVKKEIYMQGRASAYSEALNTLMIVSWDRNELIFISMHDYSQKSIAIPSAMKLALSPDQTKVLVSANENMTQATKGPNFWKLSDISLYDIETRTKLKTFPFQNQYNALFKFISDDRLMMNTDQQGMHIINVENDQFVKSFSAGLVPVVDIGYDVEGDRLATHHQDTIYLWDRRMQRASTKLVNARVGFREAHYGFFPTYRSSYEEHKTTTRKRITAAQDSLITRKLHGDRRWGPKESNLVNPPAMFMLIPSHDDESIFMAGRDFKKKGINIGLYQFKPSSNQIIEYDGHVKTVELAEQSHDHKHAYSAAQGEIKTWEQSTQKLITTSYLFKDGGFVTLTPDGYYTSSLNAVDQVVFAKGKEAYTFENFDLNYNRPDIIAKRLGVASPEFVSVLKKAWVKRLKRYGLSEGDIKGEIDLPLLTLDTEAIPLETSKKVLEIPVRATSSVALNRYIVSVNGVPLNHTEDFQMDGSTDQRTLKIELTSGENRIKIVCLNSTGFKSLSQSLSINYTQPKIKPNLYLLSIGVSEFKQKDFNLTYADKDAQDVISLFESGSKYGKVISIPLLNKEANLKEFESIKKQLQGARPEDYMIIFVASHGLLSDELDYYLAMNDVDFESPDKGGLLYEHLEEVFKLSNARNRLVFLDACHSGEVDKDETTVVSATNTPHESVNSRGFKAVASSEKKVGLQSSFDLMKELFVDLEQSTGATVISSASGEEYAFESPQWNNGVFTYALLRGLKHNLADKNKDGQIRISEIRNYVYEQVHSLTNGKQNPTSRTENTENDFVVW